jgi:hypothetical protein
MRITKLLSLLCILFVVSSCHKKNKDDVSNSSATIAPNDFLASTKYDKLVIQIQAVSGYELTDQTVTNLVSFLEQRLNKPGGIEVLKNSVASPGKATLTLDDLMALEKTNRTQFSDLGMKTLTAYFFVADGEYSGSTTDSKVLGIAYSSSAMVLFEQSIRSFTGNAGQPSLTTLESTVIEHEFGHILGLVNDGTNMQTAHQDEPHGKHCNNTNCLMYYDVETSASVTNIFGGGIPSLDTNCLNDLKANGGK